MKLNVRIQGEYANTKFRIENYSPDEEATLDGAIKNIEGFENENSVIVDVEKLRVEEDHTTADYNFYRVQLFNASKYALDLDMEELEDIKEYVDYDYVCVRQ